MPKGDQLWQHSDAVQQRADAEGNWLRSTDARITDQASERQVHALDNAERYQVSSVEVDDHSTESVGGIKTIEALGALKLLSGGSASLAAVDDLHLATGRDLNLVVGQKYNATVGGDMREQILGMRESVAGLRSRQRAAGAMRRDRPTGTDEHRHRRPQTWPHSPARQRRRIYNPRLSRPGVGRPTKNHH